MSYVSAKMQPARIARGITLKELAMRIGKSESHVRNVESGDKPMKDEYLVRIGREIGLSLDELRNEPPDQPRTKQPQVGAA